MHEFRPAPSAQEYRLAVATIELFAPPSEGAAHGAREKQLAGPCVVLVFGDGNALEPNAESRPRRVDDTVVDDAVPVRRRRLVDAFTEVWSGERVLDRAQAVAAEDVGVEAAELDDEGVSGRQYHGTLPHRVRELGRTARRDIELPARSRGHAVHTTGEEELARAGGVLVIDDDTAGSGELFITGSEIGRAHV